MKKIVLILISFFWLHTNAQLNHGKRYKKEVFHFLQFVRQHVINYKDTCIIRPYLCNKGLFVGTVLVGRTGLTKQEKEVLVEAMLHDTARLYLSAKQVQGFNCKVEQTANEGWMLSKPIFLRSYTLCVFSYGNTEQQKTFLYKKEKGQWAIVEKMGGIDDY